jgi:hypothetical protein
MDVIERIRSQKLGFIQDVDLPLIIAHNPSQPLLVRCGGGRFLCAADQVEHFMGIITREKTDYVRDVSLPASN